MPSTRAVHCSPNVNTPKIIKEKKMFMKNKDRFKCTITTLIMVFLVSFFTVSAFDKTQKHP